MKIAFWISGKKDPSPRFRFIQFVEPLQKLGHQVDVYTLFPHRNTPIRGNNKLLQHLQGIIFLGIRSVQFIFFVLFKSWTYDIIYTNKDIFPNLNQTWPEKLLQKFNNKLIFDIDDAIYLGPRGRKLSLTLKNYAAVIAGSPILQSYVEKEYDIKCYYVPMAINTAIYKNAESRIPGPIRIGWSGSHHTNVYALPLLQKPLEELAKHIDFEFIVISNKNPEIQWSGVKTHFIPWSADTEVSALQLFDVGLMPLKDEPFEQGKCALKAVQYMAIGIPALVSPVGVNQSIVRHGVDGLHCNSIDEFSAHLQTIARDETMRHKLGNSAITRVKDKYSIEVLVKEYEKIFYEIASTNVR